jgi:hypothetical protein
MRARIQQYLSWHHRNTREITLAGCVHDRCSAC